MADEDDTKVVDQDSNGVDATESQDETDESQGEATSSESTETGEQENQTKDDYGWDPEKRRFTQFKGETRDEYLKRVEEAYAHSYGQYKGVKDELDQLRAEKLSQVANADSGGSEREDKKNDKPPSPTETLIWQQKRERDQQDYLKFTEQHPEVNEDDELFKKLDEQSGKYMDYVYKTEGRIPYLAEALRWAWGIISPDDTSSKEERVAAAVKNAGSANKSKGTSKDQPKPRFSEGQIETARKLDPSLVDKSRTEIEDILAKYKK